MEKISIEDALRIENAALKKSIADLKSELASKDERILLEELRGRYGLTEGDRIDPSTLRILRRSMPVKVEPSSKSEKEKETE